MLLQQLTGIRFSFRMGELEFRLEYWSSDALSHWFREFTHIGLPIVLVDRVPSQDGVVDNSLRFHTSFCCNYHTNTKSQSVEVNVSAEIMCGSQCVEIKLLK